MKITINKSENISAALEHSLKTVLGLPADAVVVSDTEPTSATAADGKTYRGVMAIVRVVRAAAADPAKQAFLSGEDEEQAMLIDQWVNVAATLSAETAHAGGAAATQTVRDVEHIMEAHSILGKFLACTAKASLADVLFYGALHGGRSAEATKALPSMLADWSAFVQADASLAAIKSTFATAATAGKAAGEADGSVPAATGSAFVKPSDEEIQRRREEKERVRKEKEAAKAAAGGAAPEVGKAKKEAAAPKKELDASSLDVRVGRFSNVRKHEKADRLYVEDMDLGDETRTIVSGLVEHFADPSELDGRLILVVCNMKPKPLMEVTSHGMILCASDEEGLALVSPPEGAKPGDRIVFGDAYAEPGAAAEVLSGSKMGNLIAQLRTNGEGVLCWKDTTAHHANGIVCCPTKKNCIVK